MVVRFIQMMDKGRSMCSCFIFELFPVVVQHICFVLFNIFVLTGEKIDNSELMVSELDFPAWLLTVWII